MIILDLTDDLQVKRVRVMGVTRILIDWLHRHDAVSPARLRPIQRDYFVEAAFFIPVDPTGPSILAKVLECYPIARIADRAAA